MKYRVDYYLNRKKETYYFNINKEIDFLQIIDNSFLFVSSNSEKEEDNAFLFNKHGDLLQSFYVGSGVEVCRVDDEDCIWIGYNDEGIFEPNSLGADGVVCFNKNGQIFFNDYHNFVDKKGIPPIDHCNAITVYQKEVWICYYSENYQLVQLKRNKTVQLWGELEISSVNSVAIGKEEAIVVTCKEIVRLNFKTGKQITVMSCNENGEKIRLENPFTSGNKLFGISGGILYVTQIL